MSEYTGSWEEAADNWKIRAEEAETQLTEARRLLKDAEDTILSNCVVGEDGNHHIDYHCIGQYGYDCRCFAEDTLNAIRAFLGES